MPCWAPRSTRTNCTRAAGRGDVAIARRTTTASSASSAASQCGRGEDVFVGGYSEANERVLNYPVLVSSDEDRLEDAFICFVHKSAGDPLESGWVTVSIATKGIEAAYATMKAALEPLGLWDDASFGFWAVGRC